jgi:hypothetical protein
MIALIIASPPLDDMVWIRHAIDVVDRAVVSGLRAPSARHPAGRPRGDIGRIGFDVIERPTVSTNARVEARKAVNEVAIHEAAARVGRMEASRFGLLPVRRPHRGPVQ